MREELHRFFRAARGAGVRVSPAESIDAMRAVADVGFSDRGILRDTLLLTLAKSEDEKQALGDCFDLFFSQPEVKDETAPEDAAESAGLRMRMPARPSRARPARRRRELGELAQMLMSRDRNAIAAALANAAECRLAFRHPLFHPARHLLDPDSRGARHRPASRRSGCADGDQSGAKPSGSRRRSTALRENVRDVVNAGAVALRARGEPKTCAMKSCATRRSPGSSAGRSSR